MAGPASRKPADAKRQATPRQAPSPAPIPDDNADALVLGIDLAATGLELILVDAAGAVVATHRRSYPGDLVPGRAGDPSDWWRAVRTGTKDLLRRAGREATSIRAVGVVGEHACVAVDRKGMALADATLGPDPRASVGLDILRNAVGARTFANLVGGTPDLGAGVAQLLALREREKRAWHDLAQVLSAKDFIRLRLCGTAGTDPTDAAATLLYSARTKSWSKQLLNLLGLDIGLLPPVGVSHTLGGRVTEAASRETGLSIGTPVVTGCHRLAAMAVAADVAQEGHLLLELGGSGGVLLVTGASTRDPDGRCTPSCHPLTGTGTLATFDASGSAAAAWILGTVLPEAAAQAIRQGRDPLLALAETAADAPAGAEGLRWSLSATGGSLVGLRPLHTRAHVARAALEGAAMAARTELQRLAGHGLTTQRVTVVGQGAAAPLWCQITADVLNREVTSVSVAESGALGVALLAAGAVGLHRRARSAKTPAAFPWIATWQPRKAAVAHYLAP